MHRNDAWHRVSWPLVWEQQVKVQSNVAVAVVVADVVLLRLEPRLFSVLIF